MTNNNPQGAGNYSGNERRAHRHLREYFDNACHITASLLAAHQGMDGAPLHLSALQTLRNHYPQLSQQEIAILFSAVKNYHGVRMNK
ncbi:MAG: hypothetical protein FD121_1493 [Gallionellaceae bacterium]|nr:MAG: hypothetical protein FD121_1493 [Gallionellaceae bacterium]